MVLSQQEVRGNYGFVRFQNCIEALESYQENQFALCLTDPPWGHEYDGERPMGINAQTHHPERVSYEDTFDPEFNLKWLALARKVCRRVVVAMGWKQFNWWVEATHPLGYFFLMFKNGQGQTKVCNHNAVHPFMIYGQPFMVYGEEGFRDRSQKFHWNFIEADSHRDPFDALISFLETLHGTTPSPETWTAVEEFLSQLKVACENTNNVLETYIPNGFLNDRPEGFLFKHPSPKPYKDWAAIAQELHAESLLDPFAGSGCIGEVGESLGIPWAGFELNPVYREDCEYRIRRGTERARERAMTLDNYF